MPAMDGYEVCSRLKAQAETTNIPIIFVTSLGDSMAEVRGFELGAVDYINKPVSPPVVRIRVRNQIELKKAKDALAHLVVTDGLTGVFNRRHFDNVLHLECQRLSRSNGVLSLVLFDVDFFKCFNDTYGHLAGDDCLRSIGKAILHALKRTSDIGARYGGEEFACILPETDSSGACKVAETLRQEIAALAIPHAKSTSAPYVTASFGVVTCSCMQGVTPSQLITLADRQLYAAKTAGRNCICTTSV